MVETPMSNSVFNGGVLFIKIYTPMLGSLSILNSHKILKILHHRTHKLLTPGISVMAIKGLMKSNKKLQSSTNFIICNKALKSQIHCNNQF
jgi:hypothetical protein